MVWLAVTLPTNALAVSGHVFRDGNGNGQKDTGELGIPGITVKAFTNGTPETLTAVSYTHLDVYKRQELTPDSTFIKYGPLGSLSAFHRNWCSPTASSPNVRCSMSSPN